MFCEFATFAFNTFSPNKIIHHTGTITVVLAPKFFYFPI